MTEQAVVAAPPDSFWARLRPEDRAALCAIATARRFPPGALVCRQGEQSRHVLLLRAGHLRITAQTPDGREIVMAVRGPGDIVGELAAVDAQPRSANVLAMDQVDCLAIPGDRFARLCQARAGIGWALLNVVTERLRGTGRQWLEYGGGTTEQRVVALLLDLSAREGRPTEHGVEIITGASQQQLAATVATSRESMARVLRRFRGEGLISTGRGRITVHDLAGLRRLAP